MSGNSLHPVQAAYQHHTDAALCVAIDDSDYWFPLVTIEVDDPLINYERNDEITFHAQEWILVELGLDYLVEA